MKSLVFSSIVFELFVLPKVIFKIVAILTAAVLIILRNVADLTVLGRIKICDRSDYVNPTFM